MQDNTSLDYLERREFGRKDVRIGASAVIANCDTTVDCTIIDVSESGAKLELTNVDIITARFKLFVPENDYIYDCEVVWRSGGNIGVRFMNVVSL